jgi:hypothetical protein
MCTNATCYRAKVGGSVVHKTIDHLLLPGFCFSALEVGDEIVTLGYLVTTISAVFESHIP